MLTALAALPLALAPLVAGPPQDAYLLDLTERCTERFLALQDAALYARGNLQRLAGPPGSEVQARRLLGNWDAYYASHWMDGVRDLALDLEAAPDDPSEAREGLARFCADLPGLQESVRWELLRLAEPAEAPTAPGTPLPSLLHDFRQRLAAIRRALAAAERGLLPSALARPEAGPDASGRFESAAGSFALEVPEAWGASTLGVDPRVRLRLSSPTGKPSLVVVVMVESYTGIDAREALNRRLEHGAHEGWEGYRRLRGAPFEHPAWAGGYALDFTAFNEEGTRMRVSARYVHGADPGRVVRLVAGGTPEGLDHWAALLRELVASLRPLS